MRRTPSRQTISRMKISKRTMARGKTTWKTKKMTRKTITTTTTRKDDNENNNKRDEIDKEYI